MNNYPTNAIIFPIVYVIANFSGLPFKIPKNDPKDRINVPKK